MAPCASSISFCRSPVIIHITNIAAIGEKSIGPANKPNFLKMERYGSVTLKRKAKRRFWYDTINHETIILIKISAV